MIQIEEMIIRVPGMGAEDARLLGGEVASRMAARIPETIENKQIDELNIRLSLSPGMGRDALADNIATQILQQLKII
ncbi:MAG: hypothetical protein WKF91_11820 [Segetibacter sp.]